MIQPRSTRAVLLGTVFAFALVVAVLFRETSMGFLPGNMAELLVHSNAALYGLSAAAGLRHAFELRIGSGIYGAGVLLPLRIWLTPLSIGEARWIDVLLLALNASTFYLLVWRLTASNMAAIFGLAVAVLAMQMHPSGAPALTDLLVLPLCVECCLLSLLLITYAANNPPMLIPTCLAFFAAVTLMPMAALMLAALAAYVSMRLRTTGILHIAALACAAIAGLAFDHWTFPLPSLAVALRHGLSVLPGTVRSGETIITERWSGTDRNMTFDFVPSLGAGEWGVTLAVVVAAAAPLWRGFQVSGSTVCVIVGVALWLASACFPSGAEYIGIFGFALVAVAIAALFGRSPNVISVAAPAAALAALFVMYGNVRAQETVLARLHTSSASLNIAQQAGEAGLFEHAQPGSFVWLGAASGLRDFASDPQTQRELLFWLSGRRYRAGMHRGGWVLSETREPSGSAIVRGAPAAVELLHVVAFAPRLLVDRGARYSYFITDTDAMAAKEALVAADGFSDDAKVDRNKLLVHTMRACGAVSAAQVFSPDVPSVRWGSGFYPLAYRNPIAFYTVAGIIERSQHSENPPWRYARKRAEMLIGPDPCGDVKVTMRLTLFSGFPGLAYVVAGQKTQTYPINQDGIPVTLVFPLRRRERVALKLRTDAPRATVDTTLPRFESETVTDVHMMVYLNSIESEPLQRTGRNNG